MIRIEIKSHGTRIIDSRKTESRTDAVLGTAGKEKEHLFCPVLVDQQMPSRVLASEAGLTGVEIPPFWFPNHAFLTKVNSTSL